MRVLTQHLPGQRDVPEEELEEEEQSGDEEEPDEPGVPPLDPGGRERERERERTACVNTSLHPISYTPFWLTTIM